MFINYLNLDIKIGILYKIKVFIIDIIYSFFLIDETDGQSTSNYLI